jgi:hypothetical protein
MPDMRDPDRDLDAPSISFAVSFGGTDNDAEIDIVLDEDGEEADVPISDISNGGCFSWAVTLPNGRVWCISAQDMTEAISDG